MILTLLIILTSITAFSIFLAINPLTIGILILIIALLLAVTFAYSISSWLALLIFLIYIGGILVIFSYFVSITPNQTIAFQFIITSITISILTMSLWIKLANPTHLIHPYHTNQTNFIFITSNSITLILLALILLFTIVIVVKITTLSKGPLRPFHTNYV
jgi:hypothetical protein